MKKFIALPLALIMLVSSMSFTTLAATKPNFEKEKAIATSFLDVSSYSSFESDNVDNDSSFVRWYNSESDFTIAFFDGKGNLTGYSVMTPDTTKKGTKLSEEDIETKAVEALRPIMGNNIDNMEITDYTDEEDDEFAYVTFNQVNDGIVVKSCVATATINKYDGTIENANGEKNSYQYNLPKADTAVVSKEDAKKLLVSKGLIGLSYLTVYDPDEDKPITKLVYKIDDENNIVDATNGDTLAFKTDISDLEYGEETLTYVADDPTNISEDSLPAGAKHISVEDAIKIANAKFNLGYNDDTVASYLLDGYTGEGYTVTVEDDISTVQIDCNGEIVYFEKYEKSPTKSRILAAKAVETASKFVKENVPYTTYKFKSIEKYSDLYHITFTKTANGIPCEDETVYVNINNEGKLTLYADYTYLKATYNNPGKIISATEALDNILKDDDLELVYDNIDGKTQLVYEFSDFGNKFVEPSTGKVLTVDDLY